MNAIGFIYEITASRATWYCEFFCEIHIILLYVVCTKPYLIVPQKKVLEILQVRPGNVQKGTHELVVGDVQVLKSLAFCQ